MTDLRLFCISCVGPAAVLYRLCLTWRCSVSAVTDLALFCISCELCLTWLCSVSAVTDLALFWSSCSCRRVFLWAHRSRCSSTAGSSSAEWGAQGAVRRPGPRVGSSVSTVRIASRLSGSWPAVPESCWEPPATDTHAHRHRHIQIVRKRATVQSLLRAAMHGEIKYR